MLVIQKCYRIIINVLQKVYNMHVLSYMLAFQQALARSIHFVSVKRYLILFQRCNLKDQASTGKPRESCFMWCSKDLHTIYMSRVRFVFTQCTCVSTSSFCRLSAFMVVDDLRGLSSSEGTSAVSSHVNGLECDV